MPRLLFMLLLVLGLSLPALAGTSHCTDGEPAAKPAAAMVMNVEHPRHRPVTLPQHTEALCIGCAVPLSEATVPDTPILLAKTVYADRGRDTLAGLLMIPETPPPRT